MRHREVRKKLGRTRSHGRAMYSNMLASLIEERRIRTTEPRARDLRRMVERVVTKFVRLGDLLLKDRTKLGAEDKARVVHAMRLVKEHVRRRQAVLTLYDEIAPRYLGRAGGYTRLYKVGFRKGDTAPMAILEFVDAPMPEKEGTKAAPAEEKKGLFDRLRRKKKVEAQAPKAGAKSKSKAKAKDEDEE